MMPSVSEDQLLEISDRLTAIAEYISGIAEHTSDGIPQDGPISSVTQQARANRKRMLIVAEQIYQIESTKMRKFAQYKIVCDPGWNIMIYIFISMLKGVLPSIKAATATAGCPPVTALRWVRALEAKGLAERQDDKRDRRRTLLRLTPVGYSTMEDALVRMNEIFVKSTNALL